MRLSGGCALVRAAACTAALCASVPRGTAFADARAGSALPFTWSAPDGCPDRGAAQALVRGFLEPSAPVPSSGHAEVQIERTPAGHYTATVATDRAGDAGERRFDGESCAQVAQAAALIVAMAFDPLATAEHASRQLKRRALDEQDEQQERVLPVRAPSLQLGLGVLAAGDAASLPAPTLGTGLALTLHYGHQHLELRGLAWLAQRAETGPIAGSGALVGLYAAGLHWGFDLLRAFVGGVGFGPELGAEVGLSRGRAFGVSEPRSGHALWAAGFLGVSAWQQDASPLRSRVSLELGVPLLRPRYELDDFGRLYRPNALTGRAVFALAWIFP